MSQPNWSDNKIASPLDLLPHGLAEAQERGAVLATKCADLMAKSAQALWETQSEMIHLETDQAANALASPDLRMSPTDSAYLDLYQQAAQRMIGNMRRVNDLVSDFGWRLARICTEALPVPPAAAAVPPAEAPAQARAG